jgi:hypothetical protein
MFWIILSSLNSTHARARARRSVSCVGRHFAALRTWFKGIGGRCADRDRSSLAVAARNFATAPSPEASRSNVANVLQDDPP